MQYLWYVLAGICSGVVAGMGMGGGTVLIPVLTIFLSIKQKMAQGLNLLAFIPTAIVSLIIHVKNKLVDFRVGIPIIITGVLASVFGSLLATSLKNNVLQILFGVFLLLIGVLQLIATIISIVKKCKNKKTKCVKLAFYTTKQCK